MFIASPADLYFDVHQESYYWAPQHVSSAPRGIRFHMKSVVLGRTHMIQTPKPGGLNRAQ
jgi:hypothetical protein